MSFSYWGKFMLVLISIPFFSCIERMHPVASAAMVQSTPNQMVEELHQLVNEYRQTKGLPALQLSPIISAEAEKHSVSMANKSTSFGHDGFEDRVRLISQKLGPLRMSAENVAHGKFGAKGVLDVWLKSPGHRKNIEGSKYNLTGIGVSKDQEGTVYFTQIFTLK